MANGNRKLKVTLSFFAACFVVSVVALYLPLGAPRATFSEWASFMQFVSVGLSAAFVAGNGIEHLAGAIGKRNGAL